MNKKDMVIVALTTFCLTTTLFMILPTRSADDPNWDPWADLKEDGTVDIFDAIVLANAYGSSGDTTKNVNVTNFPLDELGNLKISEQASLHTYKDAVEVVLFETSRIWSGCELGVPLYTIGFYFAFSPKQRFLNVTKFAYDLVPHSDQSGMYYIGYNVSINDQQVAHNNIQFLDLAPAHRADLVTDPAKCALITPGINLFILDSWPELISLLKATIVIEYYYEA